MNTKWKKTLLSVVISTSLLPSLPALNAYADEAAPVSAVETIVQYDLTNVLKAEVKSVLSEKTGSGTRIAAVVKLQNTGDSVTRVPDYDIRVKTTEGIEYTLQSSAGNAKAVQPKEKVELTYMITLDRDETVSLSELSWVDVDEYVYPKVETPIVTVPVEAATWHGDDSVIQDPAAIKKWGEPFRLPMLVEGLEFTPTGLLQEKTDKGPVTLITLLAENKGQTVEKVPSFGIDGKTDTKTYEGIMLEKDIELQPGEKKNVYMAIVSEQNAVLNSLLVATRETYAQAGQQTPVEFSVGRISIALPEQTTRLADLLSTYSFGDTMAFDPYSKMIDNELKVSMVDLSLSGNDEDGYQTVLAKLLLRNTSERPLPLPALGMELTSLSGSSYTGSRQEMANQTLMPNLSYVVDYSFTVPSSEKGELLVLKMMDNQTVAPYSVPIAGYKVAVKAPETGTDSDTMKFYPYDVKLNSWTMNTNTYYSVTGSQVYNNIMYGYKLKLDLDIRKLEDVVVDQNSSKMKIELLDRLGRIMGSESFSFTGVSKLISGEQTLSFNNIKSDEQEFPNMTINIYEAVTTPTGEAKRLVKTLHP